MEELVDNLLYKINLLCMKHHYKKMNIMEEGREMAGDVEKFSKLLLQWISTNANNKEGQELQGYILEVLNDYMNAVHDHDVVLLVDTLDYGLRELLNIFKEEDGEKKSNE